MQSDGRPQGAGGKRPLSSDGAFIDRERKRIFSELEAKNLQLHINSNRRLNDTALVNDWSENSSQVEGQTFTDGKLPVRGAYSSTYQSCQFSSQAGDFGMNNDLSQGHWNVPLLNASTEFEFRESDPKGTFQSLAVSSSSALPHYEICFGVLLLDVASAFRPKQGRSRYTLQLAAWGSMIKLSTLDSGEYVGLIDSMALCKLLQTNSFALSATVTVPKNAMATSKGKAREKDLTAVVDYSIRVVVSGPECEKTTIAKYLSVADLYLQHPFYEELEGRKYDNPHYLRPSGTEMPKLEQLTLALSSEVPTAPEVLDESKISLVMRVFDSEINMSVSPTAEASGRLRSHLKDYQYTALAMMQERERGVFQGSKFPTLWVDITQPDGIPRYRNKVTRTVESKPIVPPGGILADEMGLGKTLSMLALICWSLDVAATNHNPSSGEVSRMTLIVAPKSTINGWQDQIAEHVKSNGIKLAIWHGSSRACLSGPEYYDVILTTYETLRSDWSTKKILYSHKWRRVVLDEAHHIRSRSSQVFQAACDIDSQYRWCLTGTPIHNSLDDYGALLAFIRLHPLEDKTDFNSYIAEPIKQQQPESLHRLQDLVHATCLRRKKSHLNLALSLPPQHERIQLIDLLPEDADLYKFIKVKTAKLASTLFPGSRKANGTGSRSNTNVLTLINMLRLICDHGQDILPTAARELWRTRNSEDLTLEKLQSWQPKCDACGKILIVSDTSSPGEHELPCRHIICSSCTNRGTPDDVDEDFSCPKCALVPASKDAQVGELGSNESIQPSAKVIALIENLHQEQSSGRSSRHEAPVKSLVFSAWTKMLDLVQRHLEAAGFNIARIDGGCSLSQRDRAIQRFKKDSTCTVMLATIGSAGEGVNLIAASNVHLLEPHWNPMLEAQAINRAHRIGQQREVRTTRYITRDSIETYVQWIQQEKLRLISQSLDSARISESEIQERRFKKLRQFINSHEDSG